MEDDPIVVDDQPDVPEDSILFPSLEAEPGVSLPPNGSLFGPHTSAYQAAFTLRGATPAASPPARSRNQSASPAASPRIRARSATPDDGRSTLVADVQMTRSRLIISKTVTLFPPVSESIPFTSAIIGLRVVFHPLSQTRIKDSDIEIRFIHPMGEPNAVPIIKALYPAKLIGADTAEVKKTTSVAAGLQLGYDPFGQLTASATRNMDVSWTAHSSVIGSGVETSTAMFSLVENTQSRTGLEPSMDFALLLYLPSKTTRYFEAELTVQATVDKTGIREAARHLLGSPRMYRLIYDGEHEHGTLTLDN